MAFQSYIDPIVTLVDRYFEKRRALARNEPQSDGEQMEGSNNNPYGEPPDSPCKLLRDEKGRVFKCIYGDFKELEAGQDEENCAIWQEVIIRNEVGKTTAVETTYPDGFVKTDTINRENGRVVSVE